MTAKPEETVRAERDPHRTGKRRPILARLRSFMSWRRLLALLLLLALLPLFGTLLYRAEFTHPPSTTMLWRWITLQPVDRQWVELDEVAPILRFSVVMSEDGKFCSHGGVDWAELNAVIDDALEGEKTRGASTLTMQTARNLFLWNSRSYLRKALEIPLALVLDAFWPKHRILEVYLNLAEWDEGVFGVEAAAQRYFGVPASRLGPRQSALLAVTLPSPISRNPARPGAGMNRLARIIQRRADRSGAYVDCVR